MGEDTFPATVNEACGVCLHHENCEATTEKKKNNDDNDNCRPGLNFSDVTTPERVPFEDWHETATCDEHNETGHI